MALRNRLTSAACALVVVVVGAACGGSPTPTGTTINIAGIAANAQDPYWISVMCGGTKEAKAEGANLKWYAANTTSDADFQTNLNSAKLNNPDAYVMNPFTAATFSTQIADFMKGGTPVSTVTLITPATQYQYIHSANDVTPFAEQVAKSIGGSGTVAIMAGSTSAVIRLRYAGIVDYITKNMPNIKVLDVQYDGFDRNKTSTIVSSMIVAHPDLKLVYTTSGPEGEGAASAVQQANLQGKVNVFSFDATPNIVDALKRGVITGLIAQAPGKLGAGEVKSVIGYLKANPTKGPVTQAAEFDITVSVQLLTKANVDSASVQDYIYKSSC